MPQSKSRHPHKHIQQHNKPLGNNSKTKKVNRSVIVTVIFFALIGLGISYFIDIRSILGLLSGVVLGGMAGYFFASQVNKSLTKK